MRINNINAMRFQGGIESRQKTANRINYSEQDTFVKNIKDSNPMENQGILDEIINQFGQFKEVEAIGIGGSSLAKTADKSSDIDVYIFVNEDIPTEKREKLIKKYSSNYEVGCEYFGSGDEFFVDKMGRQLDVMYFDKKWFEDNFNNVWMKHNPSNGYTTCFLHTLNILDIKDDKNSWLKSLKDRLQTPYPNELKENIIRRNMMLLYDKPFASYYEQLEKAIKRGDLNSINHRIAAFLASYFDIIFACNELLHPGEKRLVDYALNNCTLLPEDFKKDVEELAMGNIENKLATARKMVENLRKII